MTPRQDGPVLQPELLVTALEASANSVVITDRDGSIQWVNPAFTQLTGYRLEEAVGQNPRILKSGVHPKEFYERLWNTILSGQPWHGEIVNRKKDGSHYIERLTITPVRNANGEIANFIAIKQDISVEKLAVEEYKTILHTALDGFWVADRTGHILDVNDACCRMLGYTRDELLDKRIYEIQGSEPPADVLARMERIALTGSDRFETRMRRKDGAWIDVEVSVSYVSGINQRFVVFLRDTTRQKRLEAQLLQAQKLESIGRLAGGIAHDFNNLLTVINGYADLVLSKLDPEDAVYPFVREVSEAGARAASLTQQLLAFSRKQILQPRVIDINATVSEIEEMLRRLAGEGIQVVFRLEKPLRPVFADPVQMSQVLMNLAMNAREAMPNGGVLTIETANAAVGTEAGDWQPAIPPGHYVRISVSDTGEGMDPETLEHLFEPFYTTKEVGRGSGLGLSTVYGIIQQSHGHITVSSNAGVGTTFTIYLPEAPSHARPAEASAEAKPQRSGSETLLVVEDHPNVRAFLMQTLSAFGYHVLEAANGDEALAVSQRYPGKIDLVVTDVVMPGMNGKEVAQAIQAQRPGTPVLFVSGYSEEIIARQGMIEPGVWYLPKPFGPDALGRKVREILTAANARAPILIVDDEPSVRAVLREALSSAGYEVLEAADGKEALEIFAQSQPALVVTDLVLPEKEGIEVIRTIRKERPEVGIIAISGAFEGKMLRSAELLGADEALTKPFSPERLIEAARRVLTSRRSS